MSDILIVDDEADIRELLAEILTDEGFTTRIAANSDQALAQITQQPPALCILDIWLNDSKMDGIDILKVIKRDKPEIPVVIISGHGNIEIAVAAIKQGAYDFIEKPFNIDHLLVVIRRAMEVSDLRRENRKLRLQEAPDLDIIGDSPAMKSLKAQLEKVSKSKGRTLLSGPPGSGKEIAARYIHTHSASAAGPFITVNSAAIAPERMEIEIFGRESEEHGIEKGILERAHGGVIFLDEVADMQLGTQSKMLRVLLDQTFTRVNGTTPVHVDARIISATTKNLPQEIAEGRFREELYHRLNVIPIQVPALADRRDDIPLLARYFLNLCHTRQGLAQRALTDGAAALLQTMAWPGNVRQLKNMMEQLLILSSSNGPIMPEDLPAPETGESGAKTLSLPASMASLPLREARELFEREYLSTQVERFGGNISRTSEFIGMERSALHRKLKSLMLGAHENVKDRES